MTDAESPEAAAKESGADLAVPPDLLKRLNGGFGGTISVDRPRNGKANDSTQSTADTLKTMLTKVSATQRGSNFEERQAVQRDTEAAFTDPDALRALIHSPWRAFAEKDATSNAQSWRTAARVVDELWTFVGDRAATDARMADLAPLVARARFLILSHPFRILKHEAQGASGAPDGDDRHSDYWDPGSGQAARVFGGAHGATTLTRRAMEARTVWTSYLRTYQSVPSFAAAAPSAIEDELKWVVARDGSWSDLLVLEPDQTTPLPRDEAFAEEVVESHLLPRFALGAAASAVTANRWVYLALGGAALAVPLLLLFGVDARAAAAGAGAVYVGIGVWAVFGRRLGTAPLLLRIPAAAAVGLILLVALHPNWWEEVAWTCTFGGALAVLVLASYGYLVIQCRNHCSGELAREESRLGGAMRLFLGRPFLVLAVGTVHSFLVALIGLAFVGPVFSERGEGLATVLTHLDGGPQTAAVVAGATAWCLAAGVFSQILWDDQPITAPLAHRRWRRSANG